MGRTYTESPLQRGIPLAVRSPNALKLLQLELIPGGENLVGGARATFSWRGR